MRPRTGARPRRGRTWFARVAPAVLVALLVAVAPWTGSVLAVFTATVSAGGNTVTAGSCLAAEAKTVQQGTSTSTANGRIQQATGEL